ncbi:hypothetical protein MMC19_000504 [Ptychographa xylographoides]|nr:hypothetical protein [Ptychographa xylographoides]
MDDEDLTDDQIDALLRQAESRLRGLNGTSAVASASIPHPGLESGSRRTMRLDPGDVVKPYVSVSGDVAHADTRRLLDDCERQLSGKSRRVEDPVVVKTRSIESRKATAGSDWFNLPRTILTPELKRDLQLLKMRSVLDPKRHYKKDDSNSKVPVFSHVGTIVEGPTEFYSARLQNRDRKRTLVEEVMVSETSTGRFRSRYNDVQSIKTSGKKSHYKALKEKRSWKIHN